MTKRLFGKTKKGEEVYAYLLTNSKGMKVEILNFGAVVRSIVVPDSKGVERDVVLGFDDVASYESNPSYFGAVIAPSANRIGNAEFTIDGVKYKVDANADGNNLHSHADLGSHKRIWAVKEGENSVTLTVKMADMDMGFPGNKEISVTYVLTENNELELNYSAKSDKNTILNPTNHSYFNLAGHKSGKILGEELTLYASGMTEVVPGSIPTGVIRNVTGTVMDFTKGRIVGNDIDDNYDMLVIGGGYDHNFVIDGYDGTLRKIAVVKDASVGGEMTVYSDLPGVQFYAGNFISPQAGKEGAKYGKRDALCLETQFFPDSVNHPNFPSCVFGPGKDYTSKTVYAFKYN